jgi:hypothetical protein
VEKPNSSCDGSLFAQNTKRAQEKRNTEQEMRNEKSLKPLTINKKFKNKK